MNVPEARIRCRTQPSGLDAQADGGSPLLARAELPIIRFHNLRHTAATLMLLQGENPKVVSEMLGHSSVGFTLQR